MEVLMPQLGETVAEGKITVWFKSVGDTVAPGDNLFEIETDKVSMEVPATSGGVLKEIRVKQGEIAPVSAVVAVIGDGPARVATRIVASPLARRLAAEAGIDLKRIKGSGPNGRIHAKDISVLDTRIVSASPQPTSKTSEDRVPLDAMRRTIARRLVEAKQSIPHFYLSIDINIDKLVALREDANAAGPHKLSINDFIIKAYATALQRVPAANAIWTDDAIIRYRQADVAVAVAVDGGLLTPVIRNAESKSLAAISSEMKDLAARARDRKLLPEEYQGGVATISNLGMYGVREFFAIINPPQSTILAVGAGERRPIEGPGGTVQFATIMTVTLSCDHRVVDGALGAQLLGALKTVLENPIALFL
jgi:pyruvate dehydrogenase E2 component (dihydrolipoamide acetyltransferase)